MATVVDICNLALASLGDEATVASIDPPEGSAQATHCARFYPMALDTMLGAHYWSFCTVRDTLVLLSAAPAFGWTYAYAKPNGLIDVIGVYLPGAGDDQNPQPFETEALADGTQVIYTNVENAVVRYTVRVTDPVKFSALFVDALVSLLASRLAGPIIKGLDGIKISQQYYGMHARQLAMATASDAAGRKTATRHNPDFLAVRNGTQDNLYGDRGGFPR